MKTIPFRTATVPWISRWWYPQINDLMAEMLNSTLKLTWPKSAAPLWNYNGTSRNPKDAPKFTEKVLLDSLGLEEFWGSVCRKDLTYTGKDGWLKPGKLLNQTEHNGNKLRQCSILLFRNSGSNGISTRDVYKTVLNITVSTFRKQWHLKSGCLLTYPVVGSYE